MASYLNFSGLSYYDGKLKAYIAALNQELSNDITTGLASKQDNANLITSFAAGGTNATDAKYPSAKLVYDQLTALRSIAEGKTATYVVHMEYDGTNDAALNSIFDSMDLAITQTITGSSYFKTANVASPTDAQKIFLTDLKTGDVILVAETNVPDRWVERTSDTSITFHKLETRSINLDSYLLSSTASTTYVPLTRTVNNKALSANITLSGADIYATGSTNFNSNTINTALDELAVSASAAMPKTVISTKGQIIYHNGTQATALAIGNSGQVLKVSSSGVPSWSTDSNTAHTHAVGIGLKQSGSDGTSGNTRTTSIDLAISAQESITVTSTVDSALTSTEQAKFYPVRVDSANHPGVYVPWQNEQDSAIATSDIDTLFTTA